MTLPNDEKIEIFRDVGLIYKKKYLKYKKKYIELKKNNNLSGGWGEGELIICYNKSAMEKELTELRKGKNNDKYKNLDQNENKEKRNLELDWSDTKKLFSNFEGTKIYSKNKKKLIPLVSLDLLKRIVNNKFLLLCFSKIQSMKAEINFINHIKNKDAEIKNDPNKNTGNFVISSPYEKKEIVLGALDLKKGETYLQKIILENYPKPADISKKISTINILLEKSDKTNYEKLLKELDCVKCDSVMHLEFNRFTKNKIIYNNIVTNPVETTLVETKVMDFDASKEELKKVINDNMAEASSFMSAQEKIEKAENEDPTAEVSISDVESSITQKGGKPFFLIILILIAVWCIAKLAISILSLIIKIIFKTMKEYKEIKNS